MEISSNTLHALRALLLFSPTPAFATMSSPSAPRQRPHVSFTGVTPVLSLLQKFDFNKHKSLVRIDRQISMSDQDLVPRSRLGVCKNSYCQQANSMQTLEMLRALAGTHRGIEVISADHIADQTAIALQEDFAEWAIKYVGCLERCGKGPNVCNLATREIHTGVSQVPTALQLLKQLKFKIPSAAGVAYLRRMNAQEQEKKGNLDEALSLLTKALDAADSLGIGGVALLKLLYEARGDLQMKLGNREAADEDYVRADCMMGVRYTAAAK